MAEGDPSDEPLSAAAAERLLVAGKTEQAASTAEMVLRSGRRRTVPPAERSVALSVLIQAFSQLSRSHPQPATTSSRILLSALFPLPRPTGALLPPSCISVPVCLPRASRQDRCHAPT